MSILNQQIKIGPNFFAGAFRDYADWHWAWVREIMQNSIDAFGCDKITVKIQELSDGTTEVEVINNGVPMTKDILLNKFLCLGESGKRFEGTVGGFGKAKELIAFCHKSWQISTGDLFVNGEGGSYDLSEGNPYLHGTKTYVIMEGLQADKLKKMFETFTRYACWYGDLTVNDQKLLTDSLGSGIFRKSLTFGQVFTVSGKVKSLMVTRIKGIPMYYRWVDFEEGCIILELDGSDALTANRDGLIWSKHSEFNEFIDLINMNRTAAFKDTKKADKKKFDGYKLSGKLSGKVLSAGLKENTNVTSAFEESSDNNLLAKIYEKTFSNDTYSTPFRPEFYLRNELDQIIPEKVLPGTLSKNSIWLINVWASVLVEIATLAGNTRQFGIGFVFSDESLALYEYSYPDNILYINPLTDDHKNRWTAKNVWDLVSTAVHEYCHLEGFSRHDEKYAARLTQLMGLVLANRVRISAAIKTANQWVENQE